MKREQFGTTIPLYHRLHYNNRLQLIDVRLGTDPNPVYDSDNLDALQNAPGSWNRGALRLYYSTLSGCHVYGNGGTDNNGNLLRMDHYIPVDDAVSNFAASIDRYDYDALNRLKSATELSYTKGSSGEDIYQGIFRQSFLYDQWGNRTIDQVNTVGGVNKKAYTVDAATNRLTSVDGVTMSYDAAGNQTNDGSGQRTYDGENRMMEAYDSAGGLVSWYVYDAEGRRVVRTVGSQGTWYINGIGGELLAEYAVGAQPTAAQKEYGHRGGQLLVVWDAGEPSGDKKLKWLVTDHLGSTRLEADKSGSLAGITRRDYAPFGEELYAGIRSNVSGQGQYGYEPPQSNVKQRLTGKERDTETGLDYFGARYYASTQGRFTSVDPLRASANIANPQTLNRYSYVLNRPTIAIDSDGLSTIIVTVTQHGNGYPTSSVRLVSTRGPSASTTIGSDHDYPGTYSGLAAGAGGRDRGTHNADTPFGVYKRRGTATQGGTSDDNLGDAYGTGKVLMDPIAGEVAASGRAGILIHGGGTSVRTHGGDPFADAQPLYPTHGCVRLRNFDVNELIQNINKVEGTDDALDRIFIGTREELIDMAGQKDANGNYLYPDLRIGLALYESEAELHKLIEADNERKRKEEEERRKGEEARRRRRQGN
jgi:RHS repeat-associated protein